MKFKKVLYVGILLAAVLNTGFLTAAETSNLNITEEEILTAQKDWSDGLIDIGKAYTEKKDYRKVAENVVNNLYAYDYGQVLFKPTKASNVQFRTTKEGAVSYFIGHNKNFPEDKGFALEPWVKVKFDNAGIFINNNVGMAMGEYIFTPLKGKPVKVEYTFAYEKENDGKVRIVLHHSSIPYSK